LTYASTAFPERPATRGLAATLRCYARVTISPYIEGLLPLAFATAHQPLSIFQTPYTSGDKRLCRGAPLIHPTRRLASGALAPLTKGGAHEPYSTGASTCCTTSPAHKGRKVYHTVVSSSKVIDKSKCTVTRVQMALIGEASQWSKLAAFLLSQEPRAIFDKVTWYWTRADFLILRRVRKACCQAEGSQRRFDINILLQSFVSDPVAFRCEQGKYNALISGPFRP